MKDTAKVETLNYILSTEEVRSEEEAIQAKMKFIQPKLLGIQLVKYEIKQARKVYIPNTLSVYHYEIPRKVGLKREGDIAIVFDLNEVYPFHFDLKEDELKTTKLKLENLEGICLSEKCSEKEAEEKSIEMIQWKILYRFYRSKGSVELLKTQKFYRPVWELDLLCNNKQFIKYAPLDLYGSSNEQVAGLKIRIEN